MVMAVLLLLSLMPPARLPACSCDNSKSTMPPPSPQC